jgi:AraC family transcriptional regulator, ethanolamine operon transcriptional activator
MSAGDWNHRGFHSMFNRADGTLLSCDQGSLSAALRACHMEMVLLNAHGPRAIVHTLAPGEAFLCSAESGFPFRARLTLPANRCLFGYVHHTDEASWYHGIPLTAGSAFAVMPEGSGEFMFGADSKFTLMMLPLQQVREKFAQLDSRPSAAPSHLHTLFRLSDATLAQRLRELHEGLRRRLAQRAPECGPDAAASHHCGVDALLEGHLAASLAAAADDLPALSRGRRKHYLIFQRAERFMLANLRDDIYVTGMCEAAEVSERALRYAFEDLLGISPNRYLAMLRLCAARKSLACSSVNRRSVKSVAMSCGLWDLSRFADSYRRVFGELPHATLMRAPLRESLRMY